jgi:SAM-dependent methyltransferase
MANERALLEDPIGFWERRHAATDPWRSGGDRGLTVEENYQFYAIRFGRLLELVRRHAGGEGRLRILDAGCGRGHLTDGLRRSGHRVRGIDTSATAIAHAREQYGDLFEECALERHRPGAPYDVILCIDVLFHVLDDAAWAAALAAFGRYAAAEAIVILTDVFAADRTTVQDYIVHRPAADYDRALAGSGFTRVELSPYRFGSNPNQFAVYRRRP